MRKFLRFVADTFMLLAVLNVILALVAVLWADPPGVVWFIVATIGFLVAALFLDFLEATL